MTIDVTQPSTSDGATPPATVEEALARAKAIRPHIAELAVGVDAHGIDVADTLRLASDAGLNSVVVPEELGGLWPHGQFAGWRAMIEVGLEVTAGDGSTGQCWGTTALMAWEVFHAPVPDSTKAQLATELLHEGRRMVASNAETGGTGPVVASRVDGGVVVNGVKTFNTNSAGGGSDLANVGLLMDGSDGVPTRHHALVRLDSPGVTLHGDWDNMGQRGTISQTITYDNVFVADGWFWQAPPSDLSFLAAVLSGHAMILQGIGDGAYTAALEYLRDLNRPSMPMYKSAGDDVLIHRQLGEIAAQLSASRAYLVQTCQRLADLTGSDDVGELVVEMFKSKVASTDAALDCTARLHDLTGARSTSNKYRLDRYWRNARTFASHDSIDAKSAMVGAYEFSQELPDISQYLPGVRPT